MDNQGYDYGRGRRSPYDGYGNVPMQQNPIHHYDNFDDQQRLTSPHDAGYGNHPSASRLELNTAVSCIQGKPQLSQTALGY